MAAVMSKRILRPYVDRGRPSLRYDGDQLPRVRDPEPPAHKPLTADAMREQQSDPEMSDANAALEHWAAWAKSALSGMGWPPRTLLARVIEYGVLGAAQRGSGSLLVVGSMVEYDEMCAWVEASVMRLALAERNVIVRAYLHNETPEASARSLGITFENFRQILYRARRSVRDYLDGRREAKKSVAL